MPLRGYESWYDTSDRVHTGHRAARYQACHNSRGAYPDSSELCIHDICAWFYLYEPVASSLSTARSVDTLCIARSFPSTAEAQVSHAVEAVEYAATVLEKYAIFFCVVSRLYCLAPSTQTRPGPPRRYRVPILWLAPGLHIAASRINCPPSRPVASGSASSAEVCLLTTRPV